MIPVLRMFEVVVATAFYSGICYMIFEGTGGPLPLSYAHRVAFMPETTPEASSHEGV